MNEMLKEHTNIELFDKIHTLVLPYISLRKPSTAVAMTNHEELHIENVLENEQRILSKHPFELAERDILYLMLATLVHDIGMNNYNVKREEHHTAIRDILQKIRGNNKVIDTFLTDEEIRIICDIACCHSGDAIENYNMLFANDFYNLSDPYSIKVPILAMLLRIADELDITQKRIKPYPLDTILSVLDDKSLFHWLKHKAITNWTFSNKKYSCINLIMVEDFEENYFNDIIKENGEKPKFPEFEKVLYKALAKLGKELEIIKKYSDENIEEGLSSWKYCEIELVKNNREYKDSPNNYINKINRVLYRKTRPDPLGDVDFTHQQYRDQETESEIIEKDSYSLIGSDSQRIAIDNYIKENNMFVSGHFKHKNLRILDWLDSYKIHQSPLLVQETCNTIASALENRNINLIVGIGLKGAKLASIVGIKLEIPFFFYLNDEIKINIEKFEKSQKIAIITDCIITGETSYQCIQKILESYKLKNIIPEIIGVYSAFLRRGKNKQVNRLFEEDIPVFTINDHYEYKNCELEPGKCPFYKLYGEEVYNKHYKKPSLY